MRSIALLALVLSLGAAPALAADPACSKLAWPLDKERALLNGATRGIASGSALAHFLNEAITLGLKPAPAAGLPTAPGKPADPAKFSGYLTLPSEAAGDFVVSLASEGWIDLVQAGTSLNSTAHTGDDNCPGLRKAVRFTLSGAPLVLQIENAPADHIVLAITPAPKP
jgi:hypothetical protein